MSMELDTAKHGVVRPPPESYEEIGKRLKQEPEPELNLGPEVEQTRPPTYDWESKPAEDLKESDFSMFDDDPEPFMFQRDHFMYQNKAFIKEQQEIRVAMAEYRKLSRNLSRFDAIPLPEKKDLSAKVVPLDITDELRLDLTPLCELALNKYNVEHEGSNFAFLNIVKTTWRPGGIYYITFQAKEREDPSNSSVTIFQAHVHKFPGDGPHKVISCDIKA
ncbi:hypothetical protein TSUD_331030 [Trifolium subterraneum]|uniref:Cystatin domain-containing protein n=1 Tax=Trifolium subterraneum TaxID=3900 RepID=A0A2Z6P4W7_TRISU|nr:hypothetical protein TSUD_331030 [Trifolium subterraneum]